MVLDGLLQPNLNYLWSCSQQGERKSFGFVWLLDKMEKLLQELLKEALKLKCWNFCHLSKSNLDLFNLSAVRFEVGFIFLLHFVPSTPLHESSGCENSSGTNG